jgi:hypothetical protein
MAEKVEKTNKVKKDKKRKDNDPSGLKSLYKSMSKNTHAICDGGGVYIGEGVYLNSNGEFYEN